MPEFRIDRGRPPHWRLDGGIYVVTWCLADRAADLDGAERDIVLSVLRRVTGAPARLYACVVMNDHVHVLVEPGDGQRLDDVIHSWQSSAAAGLERHGRAGDIWRREHWPRRLRDEDELLEAMRYIARRPFARWQGIESYPWMWLMPPSGTR